MGLSKWVKKKVLITIKTYPLPSPFHREIVCTGGVEENGGFIRLYPISFRYLDWWRRYRKYDWIEVKCEKSNDPRKESYKPDQQSIKIVGHIPPQRGTWAERAKHVLPNLSKSIEELKEQQKINKASMGIIKPQMIKDFLVEEDEEDWPDKWKKVFKQLNLIGPNQKPLDKIPFKFSYKFFCNDERCTGHKMMISDWEVGACYFNALKSSSSPEVATQKVRQRFFNEICSPKRDTYFYVGTLLMHPHTWIVVGLFYPKKKEQVGLWQSTPDR